MKIGIELRDIVLGQTGGVTQLLKGVLEYAVRLAPQDSFVLFCTVFNRRLLDIQESDRVTSYTLPLHSYFSEVDRLCERHGVDVLFRGYPMEDTLAFPLNRQIFQIPDIQHETYPQFFTPELLRSRRSAFLKALGGAGAIGTISEFSKRTLVEFPHTHCKDIFLMQPALQEDYLGASSQTCSAEELALIPQRPYFLFPANLWPHKNHSRLIEGFRIFLEKGKRDFELVLTGHPVGWDEMRKNFAGLPIRHLGFVRPQLMRLLMESTVALTFFSLYEGFGIPLLEAFNAGAAVLCSNSTSLPEVGGDAVLTCDPQNPEAIAALMSRLVSEPGLRETLVERGRRRLAIYNWSTSAANLIQACHRVHARNVANIATVVGSASYPASGRRLPAALPTAQEVEVTAPYRPLVSVVTPSYNQGKYLRRTIESVLTQSYPNIELIVMDGGSTDDSIDILKGYGDRVIWVSERDRGQTHAINKGMQRARGDVLAYLNSDDVLLPGAIDKVVRYFAEHGDTKLVYGKAFYIDEDDRVTGEYKTEPYSFERLAEECIICQPATFWRRELAEEIGEFDERRSYVMDYDYWLRVAKSGARIDFFGEHLSCSRLYPETKTLSARRNIYREIIHCCWEHNRYVGLDYLIGYWHQRLHEGNPRLSRLAALLPRAHVRLGRLHYVYLSQCKRSKAKFLGRLVEMAKAKAKALFRVPAVTNAYRMTGDLPAHTRVRGFLLDNWIGPHLQISRPKTDPGWVGYLQGVSPIKQRVEIWIDGKVVAAKYLAGNSSETIELQLPNKEIHSLEIVFSRHFRDACSRKLSFLVEATNLFAERDIDV
jgi:glycosyltransferase involved in cell wall biosynthesis